MEDDVAAGAGSEEGLVVGDITVDDFDGGGVSGRREGGEVAGASNQHSDRVALLEKGVA